MKTALTRPPSSLPRNGRAGGVRRRGSGAAPSSGLSRSGRRRTSAVLEELGPASVTPGEETLDDRRAVLGAQALLLSARLVGDRALDPEQRVDQRQRLARTPGSELIASKKYLRACPQQLTSVTVSSASRWS